MAGNGLSATSKRQACSYLPPWACASHAWMFSPAGQPALHGGNRSRYTGRRWRTGPDRPCPCSRSGSAVISAGGCAFIWPPMRCGRRGYAFPKDHYRPADRAGTRDQWPCRKGPRALDAGAAQWGCWDCGLVERGNRQPGGCDGSAARENAMTTTVGVNGFGRIGRAFMRRALERDDLEVVAVNDVTDARTLAHLLEFDSTYGQLGRTVEYGPDSLTVAGRTVPVLSARDPAGINWCELGASIVIESTGKFRAREDAALHLKGGARKVLISAPGKGADLTVVVGVND